MQYKYDAEAQERADRRLECLKLAQAAEGTDYLGKPQGAGCLCVLQRAQSYADFVNGPAANEAMAEDTGDTGNPNIVLDNEAMAEALDAHKAHLIDL